ncbi:MAG: hypothetical protein EOP51_15695 [Sphingobacteriales bacterium]|nr:MAG: hypothetical protein EOP51_15695 [Sphingobacteriales bacterium]
MKSMILAILLIVAAMGAQAENFKLAFGEPLHSQRDELTVKGRMGWLIKQKLTFGEYRTAMVKRSAIRSWSTGTGFPGTIWVEHMEGRQSIHFSLVDSNNASDVIAVTNVKNNDLMIGSHPERIPGQLVSVFKYNEVQQNNLSVAIYTQRDETPWQLFLDNTGAQVRRKDEVGYVMRGDSYYTIVPIWKMEKKNGQLANIPFGSAGYEIKDTNGKSVAAVSLIDNGKVYLGNANADERFLMANVCAALLLQSDINNP